MPHLDVFLCNYEEAYRLSDEDEPEKTANVLLSRGPKAVIVKLGGKRLLVRIKQFLWNDNRRDCTRY